jgi:two-component system, LytTR family, sensor histidine kinase AlgZ
MELSISAIHKWLSEAITGLRPTGAIDRGEEDSHFLPNFCAGSMILNVALIAEMSAFVFTLITRRIFTNILEDLLIISIFVQWIALASVAALCAARRYLSQLPNSRALTAAYFLLLSITFLVGETALWLLAAIGKINSPHPEWYAYFHVQNLSVSAIINALVLRYFLAKHELKQRTISEARARMQALQSRIRPHFLFNSMNSIASLIRGAPYKAEAAIEDVADLFRMMLSDAENLVPVKNEIAIAQKYLSLEVLRLDNRLRVNWDIGKFPRKAVMPVLTLQPLLENAIYYGVESLAGGGSINVKLWEENELIHISVTNPLAPPLVPKLQKGQEIVLDNIRQRLNNHYGTSAKLETTIENGLYRAVLKLPARGGKYENLDR